jgi:hypothetical protein
MSHSTKGNAYGEGVRALLRRARALADTTDRWFASLSHDLNLGGTRPPPVATSLPQPLSPTPEIVLLADASAGSRGAGGTDAGGVLPVVRALGTLVGHHAPTGYRSLPQDERFWGLVELLRMIAPPGSTTPFPDVPPSATHDRNLAPSSCSDRNAVKAYLSD